MLQTLASSSLSISCTQKRQTRLSGLVTAWSRLTSSWRLQVPEDLRSSGLSPRSKKTAARRSVPDVASTSALKLECPGMHHPVDSRQDGGDSLDLLRDNIKEFIIREVYKERESIGFRTYVYSRSSSLSHSVSLPRNGQAQAQSHRTDLNGDRAPRKTVSISVRA